MTFHPGPRMTESELGAAMLAEARRMRTRPERAATSTGGRCPTTPDDVLAWLMDHPASTAAQIEEGMRIGQSIAQSRVIALVREGRAVALPGRNGGRRYSPANQTA